MGYTDFVTVSKTERQQIRIHSWNHFDVAGTSYVPLESAQTVAQAEKTAQDFYNSTLKSSQIVLRSTVIEETADSYKVELRVMD